MPHSTREPSLNRISSKFPSDTRNLRTSMEKFPDHVDSLDGLSPYQSSPILSTNGFVGAPAPERWQARRDSALRGAGWANAHTGGHSRQKSLSDAFRTIRTRRASVSANVHEVADALKVPVSPKLIVRQPYFPHTTSADLCCRFSPLFGICLVL
jgi:solute carrier family 35 protein E1